MIFHIHFISKQNLSLSHTFVLVTENQVGSSETAPCCALRHEVPGPLQAGCAMVGAAADTQPSLVGTLGIHLSSGPTPTSAGTHSNKLLHGSQVNKKNIPYKKPSGCDVQGPPAWGPSGGEVAEGTRRRHQPRPPSPAPSILNSFPGLGFSYLKMRRHHSHPVVPCRPGGSGWQEWGLRPDAVL